MINKRRSKVEAGACNVCDHSLESFILVHLNGSVIHILLPAFCCKSCDFLLGTKNYFDYHKDKEQEEVSKRDVNFHPSAIYQKHRGLEL